MRMLSFKILTIFVKISRIIFEVVNYECFISYNVSFSYNFKTKRHILHAFFPMKLFFLFSHWKCRGRCTCTFGLTCYKQTYVNFQRQALTVWFCLDCKLKAVIQKTEVTGFKQFYHYLHHFKGKLMVLIGSRNQVASVLKTTFYFSTAFPSPKERQVFVKCNIHLIAPREHLHTMSDPRSDQRMQMSASELVVLAVPLS